MNCAAEEYTKVQIESHLISLVGDICVGSKTLNRDMLLKYEEVAKTMPQVGIPVTHTIHGGMYAREITIPKGTVITGQIYKFNHLDIMISGDITVSTDSGETRRFTGYNCFSGMAGKKRAGYAHEDTTWITVHPVTGNNGDEIQSMITADTFEELEIFTASLNRMDYLAMVDKMEMTEQEIRSQVESKLDQMNMPIGYENLYVDDSKIEGKGFFSTCKIDADHVICSSRINGKRTPAGRYINHAKQPNATMKLVDKNIDVIALKDIEPFEEITINYSHLLKLRLESEDLKCQE
ncbi:MAG: SET domain-containing protein-lysine N-methyltransferase [Immundisolibacteraceae bacterium]|nr:SET domain-containing protein-lysine N-methyltransferase [Immundisolibacteraceae bacterium]